jgi:hypothetical protein
MSLAGLNANLDKGWNRDPKEGQSAAIDVIFSLVVAAAGPVGSTLQEARHRRLLQLWWWPLIDPQAAPPKEPAIDIFFSFGGGRCRTHWEHP